MFGTCCDFQMNYTTETGAGANNNSFFDYVELDDYACWIAADSDSEIGRDIARTIVRSILNNFSDNPTILQREMKQYLLAARELAVKMNGDTAVRVGLAIVATNYSKMLCIATGNERIYHLRRFLQRKAEGGGSCFELGVTENDETERLATYSPKQIFGLFITKTINLRNDDVILLANSGFWENAAFYEVSDTLQESDESYQFLANLKRLLLRRRKGDLLSYTIVAIYINRIKGLSGKIKTVIAASLAGFILLAGLVVFKLFIKQNKPASKVASGTQVSQTIQKTGLGNYAGYEQNGDNLVQDEEYALALDEYIKAGACEDLKTAGARRTVQSKIAIIQMILDGDQLAATGKFAGALAKYRAAQKAASAIEAYNQAGLQKRTATIRVKLTVNALVAKGNRALADGNYKEALSQYTSAKTLAKNVLYNIAKFGLDAKIAKVKSRLTEEEMLARQEANQTRNDPNEAESQAEQLPVADESQATFKHPRQPEKSPEAALKGQEKLAPKPEFQNGLTVYKYNAKVGPPPGFGEGNRESLMATYCQITDQALVLNTLANRSASPCYRLPFPAIKANGLKFTVVARVKAGSECGWDFDFRGAGFRERVCLLANGIRLECAGRQSGLVRAKEWHTYCMAFEVNPNANLLVRVYVDGAEKPAVWGVSTVTDGNNYFRFGDVSGFSGYLGTLEWIAWSFDNAYTPEQISLPGGFVWK
jgi:hypothetical protein